MTTTMEEEKKESPANGGQAPSPVVADANGTGGAPVLQAELESDEDTYKVTLPSFHGPLDLLLHLIKQHKIDIQDIPIVLITEQYTAYLDTMEELSLDI